jgi:hypothetical protein
LSADRGMTWITGADWNAIKTALNVQVASAGAPGATSIDGDSRWFRHIPVLLRVNVTTRTVRERPEYSATGNVLAYKEQTQTLMLLPRHFGLEVNYN